MQIYFAPMEGVTDAIFRRVYHACFGGADKYFMPFVSPSSSYSFTVREEADFSPAMNAGVPAIPQILAKEAEFFLGMARIFRDMGYGEVNLNLGCPSGTVTGKGKGSAMLRNPDELRRFLDALYACPPLPISIKTRIGYKNPEEWGPLLDVFAAYPIHELIIHPRTRIQQYRGTPYRAAFAGALEKVKCPVVYNGDLFTAADCRQLMLDYPDTAALMLGRGVLANPALIREMAGGNALSMDDLIYFHDRLYREYSAGWPEAAAVGRMHIFLRHFCYCLDVPSRLFKQAMKATRPEEYQDAVAALFAAAGLKDNPRFFWE